MRSIVATIVGLCVVSAASGQEKAALTRIPVVKTWKDLQSLPPIEMPGGVKIRLGLEADKIPQWGGAFLYCLTDGYSPATTSRSSRALGPVQVSFHFGKLLEFDVGILKLGRKRDGPAGSFLFVQSLVVDRVGDYTLRITDNKRKLLVEAIVLGTKDPFHPWMPWLEGFDSPVTPWEGIALPNIDSFDPIAFLESGKSKSGILPTFLPDPAKPTLNLKLEKSEFVLSAETEFAASRPDYHFLARWWVNDKPFVPKQIDRFLQFSGYGQVHQDKELCVPFAFRPERLGAKSGDKIGLQLLHCEGQWSWCAGGRMAKLAAMPHRDGEFVRLSNRIDFTAPAAKSD